MGDVMKLPEARELGDQQRIFVQALLDGHTEAEALKLAGYADSVLAQHVLRSATVQAALRAGCRAKLRGELRVKAVQTLSALLDSPTPAATRLQAAKLVLEQGDDAASDEKPLSEMTEAELMSVIERAKEAKLKDVTPNNGA